ncbi:MAG: hypothetical protein ACRC0X_09620 [Brevinema sp.]
MRRILLLVMVFYAGMLHAFVIIDHNVPVYESFVGGNVIDYIDIGVPLTVLSRRGARAQFDYQGREIWIDQQYIASLNVNQKNFSESATLFAELDIVDEDSFAFVYQNKLYCIDVGQLPDLQAKSQYVFPNFSQISASRDRSVFLLTGDTFSNDVSFLNLAFYETSTKKFIPLTYFRGDKVTINSSYFSKDGRYMSLLFTIDNVNIVHVYDINKKKLILAERGILDISWYHSNLFLFTEKQILSYSGTDLSDKNILYQFPILVDTAPSTSVIGDVYFLQLDNNVYRFAEGVLQKTDFRSLERSLKGDLEQYSRGGQVCTLYKNRRLRSLSGKTPTWTLLSILDDERLLYRQQKDALQILNIYDAKTDQSQPYYWIEEPFYTFKNGISLEYITEDQEIWLFVEQAGGFAKVVRIEDIIR